MAKGPGLIERLDRTSPMQCRFLARHRDGPMSNLQIAKAAGIDPSTVCKLSKLTSWRGVSIGLADSFAKACGVDLLRPSERRDKRLVLNGKMKFLKKASYSQRRMYARMIKTIRESCVNGDGALCANRTTLSGDLVA